MIKRLFLALALIATASPAWAKIDASCANVGGNTVVTYNSPSGAADNITFTLSGTQTCYEFVNGDIGVVGPVTITAMTPARSGDCTVDGYSSCRNGWQLGLEGKPLSAGGGQALDGRGWTIGGTGTFRGAQFYGGNLPQTISGPNSVVKASSDEVNSCENSAGDGCLDYVAVLTILDAVPTNPGDMFRPPAYLTTPTVANTIRWSDLDWSNVGSFDVALVSGVPTMAAVERRFQEFQAEIVNDYSGRVLHPETNFQGEKYHGPLAQSNAAGLMRLTMSDVDIVNNAQHKDTAAGILQYGYDMAWMMSTGGSWGDHSQGRIGLAAVFAGLSGDAALLTGVGVPHGEREDGLLSYSTVASKVLFGGNCDESTYWFNQSNSTSGNKLCGDPYDYIDGNWQYPQCCIHGGFVSQPLAVRMFGADAVSAFLGPDATLTPGVGKPRANLIDYGYRWFSHGFWAPTDPCLAASAGGGPNGSGGCITGTPNRANDSAMIYQGPDGSAADSITGNHSTLFSAFIESTKDAFYDCIDAGTCAGVTAPLAAPTMSPPGGSYATGSLPLAVTVTPASGATARCTTDGSTPTTSSPVCSLSLTGNTTVKAISDDASEISSVTTETYSFGDFVSTNSFGAIALPSVISGTLSQVSYERTVDNNGADSVCGLSNGAATGYGDIATSQRMNASGYVDAVYGQNDAFTEWLPFEGFAYSPGNVYAERVVIDGTATPVTYSYYITDVTGGGNEVTVAQDFELRNSQASQTTFSHLSCFTTTGSATISNVTVGAPTAIVSFFTHADRALGNMVLCPDNDGDGQSDWFFAQCPSSGAIVGGTNGGWPEPAGAQSAGTSTRSAVAWDKTLYVLQDHAKPFNLRAWNNNISYDNTSTSTPPNRMVSFRVGAVGENNEGVLGTAEFSAWRITALPASADVWLYESDGTRITSVPFDMSDNHGYVVPRNGFTGLDSFKYRAVDSTGTSTEGTVIIDTATAANFKMPAGFPATLSSFWGTTETVTFPADWTNEVPGYFYIDGSDGNCSDAVTWGSETVPRCNYNTTFPHNATITLTGVKLQPLAGGACYPIPNQGTVRTTFSGGTEAAPIVIEGLPGEPMANQPCLTTDPARVGLTSVYGINGSNIIFSGIVLDNIRLEPRHAKEDGISDDGYAFRHGGCRNIISSSGNCLAMDSGAATQLTRHNHFNNEVRNNGERDPTLANEQDVHGTAFGNTSNGLLLDIVCSSNGGDCFQATQNNNNGMLWLGRIDSHSDSENCIDIKAHEDYLISQPFCADYRVIVYSSSSGQGNAIVQNDDDAADQSGHGRIIFGVIGDVNGPGIETSIQADKSTIYGNIIDHALGTGGSAVRVRNAKATSDVTIAFNTISDSSRGIHVQTSGTDSDPGETKIYGNYVETSALNAWMLSPSLYEVFDWNYYRDTAVASQWQCCSNSTPVTRDGLTAWQSATSLSANAQMDQDGNFRGWGPADKKPLTGADIINVFTTAEITALDADLITELQADLGSDITDFYGQVRGADWAAGASED